MRLIVLFLMLVSVSFSQTRSGFPQFRGNNTHTFYGTGEIPASEPHVIWKFKTGESYSKTLKTPWTGLGWTGQPAVSVENGKTFVIAASLDGYVYKLTFDSGKQVLKTDHDYDIIKSSPAVTDKYVIFGCWENKVHVLDKFTFKHLWEDEANYTPSASYDFDSSPAVDGNDVYVGGEDGYIHKFSIAPAFERQWLFPTWIPKTTFVYEKTQKPYVGMESSPAIYKNYVVIGSGRGKVFVVDKNTGKMLHQFNSGDDTDSSPVIDTTDMSFYIGVEKDFSGKSGGLYKFSLTGDSLWFFPTGGEGIYSTAAINGDRVVITGDDGYLYSLDKKSGKLQWKTKMPGGSWSSPVLLGDKILTGDYSGYLTAYRASTGEIIWKKLVGNYIVSTPVVWNGIILTSTRDGWIQALK